MLATTRNWTVEDVLDFAQNAAIVSVLAIMIFFGGKILYNLAQWRLRSEVEPVYQKINYLRIVLIVVALFAVYGVSKHARILGEQKTLVTVDEFIEESEYFHGAEIREVFLSTAKFSTDGCTVLVDVSSGGQIQILELFQHNRDDLVIAQEEHHPLGKAIEFAEYWCGFVLPSDSEELS